MARTSRDRLDGERETIENLAREGTIALECCDALLEWADALDEATVGNKIVDADGTVTGYAPGTVKSYLLALRMVCLAGVDPTDTTAEEFNDCIDAMHDDEGKSKATLAKYQCAAKTWFRYHDLGVDPDDIVTFTPDSTPRHDETDMFEPEEVAALREACAETQNIVRNRALLELLIFTGQRITALVTLRKGDVDVQNGYIYLNDDYDAEFGGLKGALVRGRKRPMFGARKFVRDYVEYRRSDADDDDFLFVGDPSHPQTDLDDHLGQSGVSKMLRRLADTAGVDKPVNPHNFRHYCATVLRRDYDDVSDADIEMLFGHVEGSGTLKDTYSHLFDEDHIESAEVALGYREESTSKSFTPDACPTCGELLDSHWGRCPACDEVFGPTEDFVEDLEDGQDYVRDEGMRTRDQDRIDAALAIADAVDDPEALAKDLAGIDG